MLARKRALTETCPPHLSGDVAKPELHNEQAIHPW